MKLCFYLLLIFCSYYSIAQSSLIDQLHEMQINPRLKEKVYVHTNKTAYFPDDVIWFKAYVGDSINYPSLGSKVLEVRLFDDEGTQISHKTVAINGGAGKGQITLNDAVAPGTYYLQARTNYMRNFGEDHQYLQKIMIIGQKPPNTIKNQSLIYDIQLLPEGGYLIEDVENTLGIKAILNGRSIDYTGIIIDQRGDTISSFRNEHGGLSSCSFVYKGGDTYKAIIQVQDTLLEQDVPNALAKGVSLSVDNSDEEYLKVSLKTNEATFYDQVYSNYSLLYHQDRQLFELVSVARLDSLTGLIETKKDIFLDGVHTVTLFADDRPIAQRKFYIETDRKKTIVSLEKSQVEEDSITYKLTSKDSKKNLEIDVSIAVLHKNTEVADIQNTIQSAFLLTPYLGSSIENPAYYFNLENKKRKEHLDLLLLTQGWTSYTLNELIKEINPAEKYSFETGFELKGEIKEDITHNHLVLIPNNFRIADKVALRGKSEFAFKNLSVFKGDTVRVAYQNWLGKIIKPTKIVYDTIMTNKVTNLSIPMVLKIPKSVNSKAVIFDNTKNYDPELRKDSDTLRNLMGTIDLDEVTVTERKRSEQYLRRRVAIEKYSPLVSDIGKYHDLPIPQASSKFNASLMDFIVGQGYTLRTYNNVQYYLIGYDSQAFLSINGRSIVPEQLLNIQLKMNEITNIMAFYTSILRPGGREKVTYFQVFTKDDYSEDKTVLFDKFVIKKGFDRAKLYYTPLYAFQESRPAALTEVDWKPNLKTDNVGEINFKISKEDLGNGLVFLIQGFSDGGHLISETIEIE